MLDYLKNQVQQSIRRSIDSTVDCKQLIAAIYQETGEVLGINTMRRFFGLLPGRQPRISTLNILARYLGYDSYEDFKQAQSYQDVLYTYTNLIGTGNALSFDTLMANIQDYRHFIMQARECLLTKRTGDFLKLLESDLCPQLLSNYDRMIVMGNLCGPALAVTAYTDEELTRLIRHERFMENVIYTYVDYGALNGYYGRINEIAIRQQVRNQPFHQCLANFTCYLNRQAPAYDPFPIPVSANYHPILNSRIVATRLLYLSEQGSGSFSGVVAAYDRLIHEAGLDVMESWFEVKLVAVLIDHSALYEALFNRLYVSQIAQNFHWTHYQLHLLFKTYAYLCWQETTLAKDTLAAIDPDRIYGPYRPITNVLIRKAGDQIGLSISDKASRAYAAYPRLGLAQPTD
jgi:hypothetical protein